MSSRQMLVAAVRYHPIWFTDLGVLNVVHADMHIYLENPPHDQGDRWSGRPFRSLIVVIPPSNQRDTQLGMERKQHFLEALWDAQAKFRTRNGRSALIEAEEREVESYAGKKTIARTYYNIYTRSWYLAEDKKVSVALALVGQYT